MNARSMPSLENPTVVTFMPATPGSSARFEEIPAIIRRSRLTRFSPHGVLLSTFDNMKSLSERGQSEFFKNDSIRCIARSDSRPTSSIVSTVPVTAASCNRSIIDRPSTEIAPFEIVIRPEKSPNCSINREHFSIVKPFLPTTGKSRLIDVPVRFKSTGRDLLIMVKTILSTGVTIRYVNNTGRRDKMSLDRCTVGRTMNPIS